MRVALSAWTRASTSARLGLDVPPQNHREPGVLLAGDRRHRIAHYRFAGFRKCRLGLQVPREGGHHIRIARMCSLSADVMPE
jgi:hypothetical protein